MFAPTSKPFNWRLFVYTRKNLLLGIGAILSGLLIALFAIWPQINSITETQTKIETKTQQLKRVSAKLQELEAIKISPEFSQEETINQVLPTRKPLLELLTALNTISSATQVNLSDLKIAPGQIATDSSQLKTVTRATAKTEYDSLELTLTISGQLSNVQRFLSLIEQISPITTITKINLSRTNKAAVGNVVTPGESGANNETTLTKAELTLSVHYFTQQITSSLTAPLPKITTREKEIFQTIQSFTIPTSDTTNQVQGGGNTNPFTIDSIQE